jgi:hypothetical protein
MPFITKDRREIIDTIGLDGFTDAGGEPHVQPGDLCYIFYKEMVERWRAAPRWTTAHEIYKNMILRPSLHSMSLDYMVAQWLAWEVFFTKYIMPYELQKIEENGDI